MPMREELTGEARGPLLILFGAVAFVLLIACVNVSNLQLARWSARRSEMALRLALGGDRFRVAQQMAAEKH